MSGAPIHDWLRPRLQSLVQEAEKAGMDRQAVVAAITDLVTGPAFNPPAPGEDTE